MSSACLTPSAGAGSIKMCEYRSVCVCVSSACLTPSAGAGSIKMCEYRSVCVCV